MKGIMTLNAEFLCFLLISAKEDLRILQVIGRWKADIGSRFFKYVFLGITGLGACIWGFGTTFAFFSMKSGVFGITGLISCMNNSFFFLNIVLTSSTVVDNEFVEPFLCKKIVSNWSRSRGDDDVSADFEGLIGELWGMGLPRGPSGSLCLPELQDSLR